MSRSLYRQKKKAYQILPLIALLVLVIGFIFRYSYIDFLFFTRPLALASFICASLGSIGTVLAVIDGVNRDFRGKIFAHMLVNIIFIFTFPILYMIEPYTQQIINPFDSLTPETSYSTLGRDDASFLLEGHLYKWPIDFSEFLDNDYEYMEVGENHYSLTKIGRSYYQTQPTWFTNGTLANTIARETYNLELILDGKGDIENQKVEAFKIRSREDNWDFELMGFTLLDSINRLKEEFADKITEDPNNRNTPIKYYYLESSDGYDISFGGLQGRIPVSYTHLTLPTT